MNLKIEIKPSTLIPVLLLLCGIGFAVFAFFNRAPKTTRYRGLALAGQYYRILPDFTCAGKRKVQSSITLSEEGFATKTTNPFDCTEVETFLAPEDVVDVAYDREHLGYGEGIYEKMPSEPNLMETLPKVSELWCRPQSEQAPPLDIYALSTLDSAELKIQRAEKLGDGTFRVAPSVVKSVTRKLLAGRLSYETEGIQLEAQLTSNAGHGKISGHFKGQLESELGGSSQQFIDANLVCRTSLRHGFLCPIGYVQVPPLKNYLAKDICISRVEFNKAQQRAQAMTACQKLGKGFDLVREEEWAAASKAVNHVGWNSGGAREWTKDGPASDPSLGQGEMNFRCAFHPQPEGDETIFPLAYDPRGAESEPQPVEVGIRFKTATQSLARAIRFYRASVDAAGYTIHLWNEKGEVLATATGTGNGSPGWQRVDFAEPVVLEPGKIYVASYYAASGRVVVEPEGLKFDVSRGLSLTGLANGGVLISNGGFPSQQSANNYGVDVIASP